MLVERQLLPLVKMHRRSDRDVGDGDLVAAQERLLFHRLVDDIGKLVMESLASLDPVAYVRFASVYKNFREAKDFEDFVEKLGVED